MNKWLAVDKTCSDGTDGGKIGVSGKMGSLIGSEAWAATGDEVNISDMGDDGDYDWAYRRRLTASLPRKKRI